MSPFQAPSPYFQRSRNEAWIDSAPEEMADEDYLWGECWRRFNTMEIPIFDEKAYFDTAIALAKVSENLQDFEKNFEAVKQQQNKAILDLLSTTSLRTIYHRKLFTCKAAINTTSDVCRTGCLEHFMRLLKGTAFGWEADVAEEETPPPVEEKRAEHPLDHYDGSYPLDIPPEWETQHHPEFDWTYHSPRAREARLKSYEDDIVFIGTYTQFMVPTPDDGAPRALASNDPVSPEQQHPSLASNDAPISEMDAEWGEQGPLGISMRGPIDERIVAPTKKRVRFYEDDNVSNHEPKRQKFNDFPHTPLIPIPPATQRQTDGSSSKKRSRLGDDDDDDDNNNNNDDNNSRKRQRMESLPSPPTPYLSSNKATSTDDLPQKNNPVPSPEAQDTDMIKGERKRRKSKSSTHTPRPRSSRSMPNSRSLRKSKSSAFWELDSSGKPHYISQR